MGLDRIRLARHDRGRDFSRFPGKNGDGSIPRYRPLTWPDRKARPPVAVRLDRGLGQPQWTRSVANAPPRHSFGARYEAGHASIGKWECGRPEVVTYFIGQGVGLIDGIRSARGVVQDFMVEYAPALEQMRALDQ